MNPNRFFSPDSTTRTLARELYEPATSLPIVSPHGHVNPRLFANPHATFGSPTDLFIIPDHYVTRMLYSQGIPLESLGVPNLQSPNLPISNHREIWRIFCKNFHLFRGTPSGVWLTHELNETFGLDEKPSAVNADRLFDSVSDKLSSPEFSPQRLFERFNIEVLATTDAATDTLAHHQVIRDSAWSGRIIPTFRPDAVVNLDSPNWQDNIKTLGELKKSGYQSKSIKDELRHNLREKIKSGQPTFEGVHGFENTVIPELERAILSRHNINLLGLRGQAKTRLARKMIELLDEYIPFVTGSEINDDPLNPISRFAKDLIAEKSNATPISWLHRSERFFEKLATPDVTVADLIGDVDPIKAANLKLSYADDRVIHFGMIPRANRSIFVINELPDLQARIQVALFNILQEGDIQIRGFKLRMPLDMQFVFTANPEDYTNRGSIVTPLKDRIGSQILTHYPETIKIARTITEQEAKLDAAQSDLVYVPSLAKDLLEQISFEARESEFIEHCRASRLEIWCG